MENKHYGTLTWMMNEEDLSYRILLSRCKEGTEESLLKTKRLMLLIGLFLFIFATYILIKDNEIDKSMLMLMYLASIFTVLIALICMTPNFIRKLAKKGFNKLQEARKEAYCTFDDMGLQLASNDNVASIKWQEIKKWKVTEYGYYIYPSAKLVFLLPIRLLVDQPSLVTLLEEKLSKQLCFKPLISTENIASKVQVKKFKSNFIIYIAIFLVILIIIGFIPQF